MVLDENGGVVHQDVGDRDPRPVPRPTQAPGAELRSQIVKLGSETAWNPERIQKALKYENKDVSLNTIRSVLRDEKLY